METITINSPIEVPKAAPISDAEMARQLKRQNPKMTAKVIGAQIGRKPTYVYAALRFAKDIQMPKRGRPRKVKKVVKTEAPTVHEQGITLDMIKKANESLKSAQISQLERENSELKAVIRYLEGRLYGASV